MVTVYEVLVKSLKIKSTLKLKSIVLVYEQTLVRISMTNSFVTYDIQPLTSTLEIPFIGN